MAHDIKPSMVLATLWGLAETTSPIFGEVSPSYQIRSRSSSDEKEYFDAMERLKKKDRARKYRHNKQKSKKKRGY